MNEITRIALPSLMAQSEQLARYGGGRVFGPPERIERDEVHDRLAELSRQRHEEVQAAAATGAIADRREQPREQQHHPKGHHYGPRAELAPDEEAEHGLDVVA
jgi:hypothetical protein